MKLGSTLKTIRSYRRAYKNYIEVLFAMWYRKSEDVNLILKNGKRITAPYKLAMEYSLARSIKNKNVSELDIIGDKFFFSYKNRKISLGPSKFSVPYEVFFFEDYKYLKVDGREVIDIGMSIGDSSIYFSLNGAKRIIGLEPYPYTYSFALMNLNANHVENVVPLNAGYGKDGTLIVDDTKITGYGSNLVSAKEGGEIKIYSLGTLIKRYHLSNLVLKMDCEGCEYNLIHETDETLKKFSMMQIEYHYGYEQLVNRLRSVGFEVNYTNPKTINNEEASDSNMTLGFIYAERI